VLELAAVAIELAAPGAAIATAELKLLVGCRNRPVARELQVELDQGARELGLGGDR